VRIRVLIVEPDREFAAKLRELIDADPLLRTVAVAFDGHTAIRYLRATLPDALVVDYSLSDLPVSLGVPIGHLVEVARTEQPFIVTVVLMEGNGAGRRYAIESGGRSRTPKERVCGRSG
jgi:DNA-binding NarL/FixJ family response regulator